MNTTNAPQAGSPEPELVLTRMFDAQPGVVFRAWTDSGQFSQWWGPKGFTIPYCAINPRPGGVFHCCTRSPEGRDYCSKGIFCEVVESERFVATDYFSDAQGNKVSPVELGLSDDFPSEMLMTVTFVEQDGKTRLTLRQTVPLSIAERNGATQAWNDSFDKLEAYLAGIR